MWPSENFASRLYGWANIGLIVGLVIGVIATILIVWMGNTKESYLAKRVSEANSAAAEANERAENARERAAKLELEALALRKDLLLQGPRASLLIGDERQKLISTLKPYAGQHVEVRYGLSTMGFLQHTPEPAGPDVMDLANCLISIFTNSKWQTPTAPFISTLQGPPGVTIQISLNASEHTRTIAKSLAESLRTASLKVQGPMASKLSSIPRQGKVDIFLPQVPGGPALLTRPPDTTDETIIVVVLAHPQ